MYEYPRHKFVAIKASPMSEMARWMFEYYRIPYEEDCHIPLAHAIYTAKAGGGVELPVVTTNEGVWDGYKAFLDALDGKSPPGKRLYGEAPEERKRNRDLMFEIYRLIFMQARRYFYSHALPTKKLVFPTVTVGVPVFEKLYLRFFYRWWRVKMHFALGCSKKKVAQAAIDINKGFDLIEAALPEGQPFFGGSSPGPVDIAFAAMAAPVVLPPKHPIKQMPKIEACPAKLAEFITQCRGRRAGILVQQAYEQRALLQPELSADNPDEKGMGFFSNPRTGLRLMRLLRILPAINVFGRTGVAQYSDVKDVLTRDIEFRIKPVNQKRINDVNDGDFILGLDRGNKLVHERGALYKAFDSSQLARAATLIDSEAQHILQAAKAGNGKLDIVNGYARLVASRTAALVFGIKGPSEPDQMRVIRAMFNHTFLNLRDKKEIRERGIEAGKEFKSWVVEEITRRRDKGVAQGGHLGNDVLGRMLQGQTNSSDALDDDAIRRNISGLMIGAVDTTTTTVANISYMLLTRPDFRRQVVAKLGSPDLFRGYCWEVLRFMPHNPLVLRHTVPQDLRLSDEDLRVGGWRMKPDHRVFALTLPAMHDPVGFPQPDLLDPLRPEGNYLHFGYGLHACAGREINRIQVPELVRALFAENPIKVGDMRFNGQFPDKLVVKLKG